MSEEAILAASMSGPLSTPHPSRPPGELSGEDTKLITLARSARARTGAIEGAAVRDGDGRTYAGTNVNLPTLALTALQYATASAVVGGAGVIEAAAVVTEASMLDKAGLAAVRDVSAHAPVHLVAPNGSVLATFAD